MTKFEKRFDGMTKKDLSTSAIMQNMAVDFAANLECSNHSAVADIPDVMAYCAYSAAENGNSAKYTAIMTAAADFGKEYFDNFKKQVYSYKTARKTAERTAAENRAAEKSECNGIRTRTNADNTILLQKYFRNGDKVYDISTDYKKNRYIDIAKANIIQQHAKQIARTCLRNYYISCVKRAENGGGSLASKVAFNSFSAACKLTPIDREFKKYFYNAENSGYKLFNIAAIFEQKNFDILENELAENAISAAAVALCTNADYMHNLTAAINGILSGEIAVDEWADNIKLTKYWDIIKNAYSACNSFLKFDNDNHRAAELEKKSDISVVAVEPIFFYSLPENNTLRIIYFKCSKTQQAFLRYMADNDYSIPEIAAAVGVSHQAGYKAVNGIKKTAAELFPDLWNITAAKTEN
jgi:hypothetical protein